MTLSFLEDSDGYKAKYNRSLFFLDLEKNEYSLYLTHARQVAQLWARSKINDNGYYSGGSI